MFDRFSQAAATTRTYSGLGLGLAIVRYLVELHGGRVQAASPGEGLGATIESGSPRWSSPLARAATAHVLLVDDEADARELFRSILEHNRLALDADSDCILPGRSSPTRW